MANRFRVLFYGTPEFALPTLEAVLARHDVVAVVTQPDRPAHRGRKLQPPPVKTRALAAGVPVLQPARLRDPEWAPRLRELRADAAVVVAFGQILPKAVLDAPARGSINVHGSLLPRYRGAAPVQWAIIRGETLTGVTTMLMDEGMDTVPILLSASTEIGAEETAGELAARLAVLGADVLVETLERSIRSRTPRSATRRRRSRRGSRRPTATSTGGARRRSSRGSSAGATPGPARSRGRPPVS